MQASETFFGLTSTGWTAVGSIVSAISIVFLVVYNVVFLMVTIQGMKVQIAGIKVQVSGILYSGCPVLTLREDDEGNFSIYNCGQGPALMAQWGYGRSIPEVKVLHRLDDNIIPAHETRSINIDMEFARPYGVILFAYGVTNDRFVTSISWPAGASERRVHFGTYDGEMPRELL